MQTPGVPLPAPEPSAEHAEAVADALEVLREMLRWQLAPARWDLVGEMVQILAAAVDAGDVEAIRQATTSLELSGPVRITGIGSTPVTPPPPKVRERAGILLHALTGAASGDDDLNAHGEDRDYREHREHGGRASHR